MENSPEVKVESVKAITKTSVTVTLAEAVEEATAKDFVVTVGEETVAVTGVTALASDVTGKTFVLAVSLDKKQGTVAVNDVEAVEAFDFKAPEIVAVTQASKNQITVEFSEKVANFDADSLYELYFINKPANTLQLDNTKTGSASPDAGNYSAFTAVASEDGKTVTLTIAEPLTNGAYGFNVTGSVVADTAGNQLAAVSKTVEVSGIVNEAPELKTAKYNESTGILTLGASEGISAIDASKITLTGANGKTVTLAGTDITALTSTVLSANTISIKNKINAAGLTLPFTVSLAAEALTDATAVKSVATTAPITAEIVATPKAVAVTIDEKSQTVTVEYDKAVKAVKTAVNGVTVKTTVGTTETTSTGVILTGKSTNVDGTTQVFDITNTGSSNFIAATQVASAKVSFPANAVTDTTELAVKSNAQNDVVVTYVDDTTAPTYTASYNSLTEQLTLVFDEKVTGLNSNSSANVLNLTNVKIATKADGSDAKDIAASGTLVETGASTYVSKLTTPAAELADANKAVYLVVNANVTDATGNAVKEEQRIVKVDVADYVAPTLVDADSVTDGEQLVKVDNKNQVTIKFSEKVTAETAQNLANYTIFATSNESLKLAVTEAILLSDGQTVVLKTADQMATGYTLSVKNVTDASPNANVVSSTTEGTFTGVATAATKAKVTGASFKDANNSGLVDANDTLEIVFDTQLKAGNYSVSDLVLTDAEGTEDADKAKFGTGATVKVDEKDPTKLVVTLGSGANLNFGVDATEVDVSKTTTIKTVVGDVEASTAKAVTNESETAAKISKAVFTEVTEDGKAGKGDTIVLTLDRPVKAVYHADDKTDAQKQAALAGAFGFDGHKAVLAADKKTVTITLDADKTIDWGTTTVAYSDSALAAGKATVENLFGTENATDTTVIKAASTVSPTLVGAKYFNTNATGTAGDTVVLTFDKHITEGTLTEADFKLENVTLHGTEQTATYEVNGKELIITLGTGATLAPNATINVKTGGTTNLTDVYGNKTLPAASALPLAVETDTTAPVLVSATVKEDNGTLGTLDDTDVVTLTFSEPVILAGPALTDLFKTGEATATAFGSSTIAQSADKKSVDITLASIVDLTTATPIVTIDTIKDFAGNAISAGLYDITIKFSAEQAANALVTKAETADNDMSNVAKAEAAKTALDEAQAAVTALADSDDKTALQAKLDAISVAVNTAYDNAQAVKAAKSALTDGSVTITDAESEPTVTLNTPADADGVAYTFSARTDENATVTINDPATTATVTRNASAGKPTVTLQIKAGTVVEIQSYTITVPAGANAADEVTIAKTL